MGVSPSAKSPRKYVVPRPALSDSPLCDAMTPRNARTMQHPECLRREKSQADLRCRHRGFGFDRVTPYPSQTFLIQAPFFTGLLARSLQRNFFGTIGTASRDFGQNRQ